MRKLPWGFAALALPALALAAEYTYHDFDSEIVSANREARTVTLKLDDGTETTAKAERAALTTLPRLKAGQHVVVTCRDNARGEHLAVVAIKVAR